MKAKADYEKGQPEFTKARMLLTDRERLKAYVAEQFPDLFPATPAAPASPEEQEMAQAEAALRQRGFMTKDEATNMVREEMRLNQLADQFRQERSTLEKEWDGKDGKPQFNFDEVRQLVEQQGYPSLESAFMSVHKQEVLEWYAAHKGAGKPATPVIATPGGGGAAPMTPDQQVDLNKPGAVKKDFENFLASRSS